MNGRERIRSIFNNKPADRTGFWLGNPWEETKAIYCKALGLPYVEPPKVRAGQWNEALPAVIAKGKADVDLAAAFNSDLFWCSPEHVPTAWRHPEGKPIFDCYGGEERRTLGQPGVFASCESLDEVEAFAWPDPRYLDFTATLEIMDYAHSKGMAVVGGMWVPFFHVLCDLMGMENYFIKMYTTPDIVLALTEKVLAFYLAANQRFLGTAASQLEACFFGNDLGSQQNLLISPEAFDKFVLPGIKKVVAHVRSFDLKVMLHSCGAVAKVIPAFIECGIDALHPLQARAKDMHAENLAQKFKDHIAFVGAVDTQDLLSFRSAEEVGDEVRRLKDTLGHRFVVSPSHEALLPNVPVENVIAMRDAALCQG
ncbi:MAG: uroporphyrinogen decarboxylase family protein [Planctomycetota bacterium]